MAGYKFSEKPPMVKNKAPAAVQITAEQILREAREIRDSQVTRPPKRLITDATELADYRLLKRTEFEDQIQRNAIATTFVKYAEWEESQKDFRRARSVWERALKFHHRSRTLWLKYAEFEMKNKFLNHARNVWDRAVATLPRADQIWFKYIHMEQMLGNGEGARQIFERWMLCQPDQHGWLSYINFERKFNEIDRARGIYERFVQCHPSVSTWIRYAKFEMNMGDVARARDCYERAVALLGCDDEAEVLFVAFAEFEERLNEFDRARGIYKLAISLVPEGRSGELCKKSLGFEKRFGDYKGVEDIILRRRRFQDEDDLEENSAIGVKSKEQRKRSIANEDGDDAECNNCVTVFPEENQTPKLQVILEKALEWKKRRTLVNANSMSSPV